MYVLYIFFWIYIIFLIQQIDLIWSKMYYLNVSSDNMNWYDSISHSQSIDTFDMPWTDVEL